MRLLLNIEGHKRTPAWVWIVALLIVVVGSPFADRLIEKLL